MSTQTDKAAKRFPFDIWLNKHQQGRSVLQQGKYEGYLAALSELDAQPSPTEDLEARAIGEQTPVALDDRTFIALFAKVKCEFCEEGKDEGRTCATCHGLGMRDPDLYELRSRMRNLYRSPISPEARDRAIEALEDARIVVGDTFLIDQALSALRGQTSGM